MTSQNRAQRRQPARQQPDWLRRLPLPADWFERGLILLLVGLIVVSLLAIALARLTQTYIRDTWFIMADNMLILSAPLSIVLLLTASRGLSESEPVKPVGRFILALITTIGGTGFSLFSLVYYQQTISPLMVVLTLLIGVVMGLLVWFLLGGPIVAHEPRENAPPERLIDDDNDALWQKLRRLWLFGLLFVILAANSVLWLLAPGTIISAAFTGPLVLYAIPGLALTQALLPADRGWLERLIIAAPVSIGIYMIASAWALQLGITINMLFYTSLAALVLVISMVVMWQRPDDTTS